MSIIISSLSQSESNIAQSSDILKMFGVSGIQTAQNIFKAINDYNNKYQQDPPLKIDFCGGKFIIRNSTGVKKDSLDKFLIGYKYSDLTPKIDSQRDPNGNLIIILSPSGIISSNMGVYNTRHKAIKSNWWEKDQYTQLDFFKINSNIYRREGAKTPVSDLIKIIQPSKNGKLLIPHFFDLPPGLPYSFIPSGRIEDGLKRDEMFYSTAKTEMDKLKNSTNTLFINYTGHQGPVAAVLAENGIPLSWQVKGDERIINSLQDWISFIEKNTCSNNTNTGLILEPDHDRRTRIDVSNLPSADYLKEKGIRSVVVFAEEAFGGSYALSQFPDTNDPAFKIYLLNLEQSGIDVKIIGLDKE